MTSSSCSSVKGFILLWVGSITLLEYLQVGSCEEGCFMGSDVLSWSWIKNGPTPSSSSISSLKFCFHVSC